jgi:hypothetical protein
MLAKAGVDVSVLECGTHWPYNDAALKALAAAGEVPERAAQQLLGQTRRLRLPGLPDGAGAGRPRAPSCAATSNPTTR